MKLGLCLVAGFGKAEARAEDLGSLSSLGIGEISQEGANGVIEAWSFQGYPRFAIIDMT